MRMGWLLLTVLVAFSSIWYSDGCLTTVVGTQMTASNPIKRHDFGWSVAISGRKAVAGARGADWKGNHDAGSVYSFAWDTASKRWVEEQEITYAEEHELQLFGKSLGISSGYVIVGANVQRIDTDIGHTGALYVYHYDVNGWTALQVLVPTDTYSKDDYAFSSYIHSNTIAVGSPLNGERKARAGAVFVYERMSMNFGGAVKLLPEENEISEDANFGFSVGAAEGIIVAGAPMDVIDDVRKGSVFVFEKLQNEWTQVAKLIPEDNNVRADLGFGTSVSVYDELLAVGATDETSSGFVAVYKRATEKNVLPSWTLVTTLQATERNQGDLFGSNVRISGGVIAVSALYANTKENPDTGAVYVFAECNGSFEETERIVPNSVYPTYGSSIGICDGTLLVGHPLENMNGAITFYNIRADRGGGAYGNLAALSKKSTATATLTTRFLDEDIVFGEAVAVTEQYTIIGNPSDEVNGRSSGSVHVMKRAATTPRGHTPMWILDSKLYPYSGHDGEMFGSSIAAHGNTIVVGAIGKSVDATVSGVVYIFRKNGGSEWKQKQLIAPIADSTGEDAFGFAVAINEDMLIAISAPQHDTSVKNAGAVYLYSLSGTEWIFKQKIRETMSTINGRFGHSLSLKESVLAVSAPFTKGDDGEACGSVYLYSHGSNSRSDMELVTRLTAPEERSSSFFGKSLATDGRKLVVGTRYTQDPGAAYVYGLDAVTSMPSLEAVLTPTNENDTRMRCSGIVSMSEGAVVVGAVSSRNVATLGFLFNQEANWSQTQIIKDDETPGAAPTSIAMSSMTLVFGVPAQRKAVQYSIKTG